MSRTVNICDVCLLIMGQSPDSASYNKEKKGLPFYQGNADFGEINPIPTTWCTQPKKIAETGDILISVRAPIGDMNIANETCCIGRGLTAIRLMDDKKLDKEYLYCYLESIVEYLQNCGTGATFKAISKKVLEGINIPCPSLDKQIEIATTIKNIKNAKRIKQQEIAELDELVKSKFIEMFGDPVENPYGLCMFELGKRCEIITGNTPSRADEKNYGDYIEWIKSDNINTPYTYLTQAKEYLSEQGFKKGRFVESGAILMTCIAGSIGCIGNVAITDRAVTFNQQINAIVPKQDKIWFLYWLVILSKEIIHSPITKSLKAILSKGQLSELKFPFPSVEQQEIFSIFAENIDKAKDVVRKQIADLQELLEKKMDEYFN